jgi:hypothetical protein
LDAAESKVDAERLIFDNLAPAGSPGRLAHTNLRFFIETIDEGNPRFPGQGTRSECCSYVALANRLHARGELSDQQLAEIERLPIPLL